MENIGYFFNAVNENGEMIGLAPGVTVISVIYAGKTSKLTVYMGLCRADQSTFH
ncbi:hypothetical protein ABER61_02490 [Brevibacillus formosus]|uniref:hypothetical protein n=1 Tax=Brevibacillus formosus TaxID=54913 RepID=UPI000B088973|nr:hypothetical protein [Brevibacillus formosus]MED1955269.1 hypothetical protein [Brevibacillus formosus]